MEFHPFHWISSISWNFIHYMEFHPFYGISSFPWNLTHFMEFHRISFTFRILFNSYNSFHFSIVAKALFYVQIFLGLPIFKWPSPGPGPKLDKHSCEEDEMVVPWLATLPSVSSCSDLTLTPGWPGGWPRCHQMNLASLGHGSPSSERFLRAIKFKIS